MFALIEMILPEMIHLSLSLLALQGLSCTMSVLISIVIREATLS